MISLVIGLGNIGEEYVGTRHNAGFEVLDRVAKSLGAEHPEVVAYYRWTEVKVGGGAVVLAWPTTLMNRSGRAVKALQERYEFAIDSCLVVVDDFNLPLGTLRFRERGSDGGHNGLESIIMQTASQDFPRLRLGIGPAPESGDVIDFVLGRFSDEERKVADKMYDTAAEAVEFAIRHRLEEAMSRYNGTSEPQL